MNQFVNKVAQGVAFTANGALTYASTGKDAVDLFGSIGSSRNNMEGAVSLFEKVFGQDRLLAMKILFWCRDARSGAGEREVVRQALKRLEQIAPDVLVKNIKNIPFYGRWDDLLIFETDRIKKQAYSLIETTLRNQSEGVGLCAKWMPRKGEVSVELRNFMRMSPKQYRKTLVTLSNTVEQKLCAKEFTNINYEHVPSVAAMRYQQTFSRHDAEGYAEYRRKLTTGEAKINASVLFPHEIARAVHRGDMDRADLLNAQWNALPDYMVESNERILPMIDVSGSMGCSVGGTSGVMCMDVAVGLGAYVALKQKGDFNGMYLTFDSDPQLCKADNSNGVFHMMQEIYHAPWGGSTNIQAAFARILDYANAHRVPQSDMPTMLMVLSDMELNPTHSGKINFHALEKMYSESKYVIPKIVWWNLNANYTHKPVGASDANQMLISGYSPAILKAVLNSVELPEPPTPYDIMMSVINDDRYSLVTV